MNASFVNVKVDREERPDVDKVYMSFVQALTGGGGWPMSVFLTPELKVGNGKIVKSCRFSLFMPSLFTFTRTQY